MFIDIAGAIVKALDAWLERKQIDQWARLVFSILFSFWTSFGFTCGSSMMSGKSYAFSIGSGLVMGACMATLIYRRSPLTKGTMVALPGEEAVKEMQTNTQVISK